MSTTAHMLVLGHVINWPGPLEFSSVLRVQLQRTRTGQSMQNLALNHRPFAHKLTAIHHQAKLAQMMC